ncbi:MAG: hypothetical protein LUQ01_05880 [Methanolinea sp.]|nr:hypothetical protein [Methanolinea sp.]
MDEIEMGFQKLVEKIEKKGKEREDLSEEVRKHDVALLGKMASISAPLIPKIGLNMLSKGKQDTKGELFDTVFYPKKMIILGKTDPVEYRPDDVSKKVVDQFCVLSEDGLFYELMYSSDTVKVDSYLNPLTPEVAVQVYGNDLLFMLYRAMRDYLKGQEDLIDALGKTLNFLFPE